MPAAASAVSIETVGPPETVFDYDTMACDADRHAGRHRACVPRRHRARAGAAPRLPHAHDRSGPVQPHPRLPRGLQRPSREPESVGLRLRRLAGGAVDGRRPQPVRASACGVPRLEDSRLVPRRAVPEVPVQRSHVRALDGRGASLISTAPAPTGWSPRCLTGTCRATGATDTSRPATSSRGTAGTTASYSPPRPTGSRNSAPA